MLIVSAMLALTATPDLSVINAGRRFLVHSAQQKYVVDEFGIADWRGTPLGNGRFEYAKGVPAYVLRVVMSGEQVGDLVVSAFRASGEAFTWGFANSLFVDFQSNNWRVVAGDGEGSVDLRHRSTLAIYNGRLPALDGRSLEVADKAIIDHAFVLARGMDYKTWSRLGVRGWSIVVARAPKAAPAKFSAGESGLHWQWVKHRS